MDKLTAMNIFIRVTELGSFSKAADEINTSPSYISKQISALEQSLGARLLQRTTRVLSLTEAGESYLHHCRKVAQQLAIAESEIAELQGTPAGLLRVSMPSVLGEQASALMYAQFMRQYPSIELDIMVEDRFVDMVEEGFDICIRASESFPDSNLIYKPIGELAVHLKAAPDYLAQYGHPRTAKELAHHPLIAHRYGWANSYRFVKEGTTEQVAFERKVRVNNTAMVRHLLTQGMGVGFLPVYRSDEQSDDSLVTLLPDYQDGTITISMVYPARTFTPLKVHKFIAFFQLWFEQHMKTLS